MALFLYWFSVFMVFYVYIGYPIVVMLLSLVLNKKVSKRAMEPSVTILIAAYNEAENIHQTVQNKLDLDYPEDKLEIIVISDESTDGTDDLVNAFGNTRVRLLRQEPRAGKTAALNMALSYANGDILIFSDANSIYDPIALKKLVANFSDGNVGYVTGKMVYVNQEGSVIGDGCSAYMKYENLIRLWETKTGSIVGVDGGIDAVRKKLYKVMEPDQLPDFVLPLQVVSQGFRVVYEPDALLNESSLKTPNDEYKMRVRVSLRAMWALWDMRNLLGYKENRFYSWQLWSHKTLRYACFVFLIVAFFSNIILISYGLIYLLMGLAQIACYGVALFEPALEKVGHSNRFFKLVNYFVLINVAAFHAFLKFISGKKQIVWSPRKG